MSRWFNVYKGLVEATTLVIAFAFTAMVVLALVYSVMGWFK
jgi:hypothetical protein